MIKPTAAFLLLTALLLPIRSTTVNKSEIGHSLPVTQADVQALILAIQDEIYDEGCQGYDADASEKGIDHSFQLPLYVQHSFNGSGLAWAIYKFLPEGEVLREFALNDHGLVYLGGHPEWHFPPTEPSHLTVYMDDDQLCQFKHEWIRTSFALELRPTAQRLHEAAERQKLRFGGDYRPHKHDCSFDWR
ncbi:MAG: hypothetical protein ACLQMT_06410 [Candidatus Acidiferrales bacterium]